jgi:hypothetical protein
VRTGFACVAGFDSGLKRIAGVFKEMGVRGLVQAGDTLTNADRCFHSESRFFSSEADRLAAELIAVRAGEQLDKKQPLGYGNAQAAVVLESRCPFSACSCRSSVTSRPRTPSPPGWR